MKIKAIEIELESGVSLTLDSDPEANTDIPSDAFHSGDELTKTLRLARMLFEAQEIAIELPPGVTIDGSSYIRQRMTHDPKEG